MTRARTLLLAGCALAVLLGLVAIASGHTRGPIAAASSSADEELGPIPTELPQSRCAHVAWSPHVVKVGETITATAGPATDECGGPAEKVGWVWDTEGLKVLSGCGPTSASCTMRATEPTGTEGHRYTTGCISGSSPFGGWESCDYYAVEGCGGAHASARAAGLTVTECCIAQPSVSETAHAVRQGQDVEVVVRASNLGKQSQCGRARLSTNRGGAFTIKRTGSSEVGRATLSGRESCFANVTATVVLRRGGSGSATAEVAGGTPKIDTARAHRTATGTVQVLAKLSDLRAESSCGAVTVIDTPTGHATRSSPAPLAVLSKFSGTNATARARLKRSEQCLTSALLSVRQGPLGGEDTARAVRVTGKEPSACLLHRSSP